MSRRSTFRDGILACSSVGLLAFAALIAGCDDGSSSSPLGATLLAETGVARGVIDPVDTAFESLSATNGDPDRPIDGPFAIRGRNIRYENGALVVDLSVANEGEAAYPEPVSLTFISLLPDTVTVRNPDNGETGVGASIVLEFENDDGLWTPGEESLPRPTAFEVDPGVAIAFVARIDVGSGEADLGSIGGIVWEDADGDGVLDPDEEALRGAVIELGAEGMRTRTTRTRSDGSYRFDGLAAGLYTVRKIPREGEIPTTPSPLSVVLPEFEGEVSSFLAANFGCRRDEPGSIAGTVFHDDNRNGVQDLGEPGLEGLPVGLIDSDGKKKGTKTGSRGRYAFSRLVPGVYTVVGPEIDGWISTTPRRVEVTVRPDRTVEVDFGLDRERVAAPGTGSAGYWSQQGRWPVDSIEVGGRTYTDEEARSWLGGGGDDVTVILFRQLVAAKLNVLIGNDDSCIEETIVRADRWLAAHPVGSGVSASSAFWKDAEPWKDRLDRYNNGQLCAPKRD